MLQIFTIKGITEEGGKMHFIKKSGSPLPTLITELEVSLSKEEKIVGYIIFLKTNKIGTIYKPNCTFVRHKRFFGGWFEISNQSG